MEPPYLLINRASELLKTAKSGNTLEKLVDELEILYKSLGPELQGLASKPTEEWANQPNSM